MAHKPTYAVARAGIDPRELKAARRYGTSQAVTQDILDLFAPEEGEITFYYGRIRNGKTYAATADILELLQRGEVVFANWRIDFPGFDERDSFPVVLISLLTGRRHFFRFDSGNLHYLDQERLISDSSYMNTLSRLFGGHLFIDEGQWIFNSMERNPDTDKLRLVLHNGHHCRSLNLISQRPINIFRTMRSQVQIWYKCEKRLSWPWLIFQKTAFEEMKEDVPDEEQPSGRPKTYFADKRVLEAYNTHGMRDKDAIKVEPELEYYETTFVQRVALLLRLLTPKRWRGAALPRHAIAKLME